MSRFSIAALAVALSLSAGVSATARAETAPHFVSLAAASANGRVGPGFTQRVAWIYQRPGLPLEVLEARGAWRRVRDPDGAETWMHARNLDARRMAMVSSAAPAALRRAPTAAAGRVAVLAPGVIGALTGCDGNWRRIAVGGRVGWLPADALWGAADCGGL